VKVPAKPQEHQAKDKQSTHYKLGLKGLTVIVSNIWIAIFSQLACYHVFL
jgi:hypothetical protein